jgi:hypothetical protein
MQLNNGVKYVKRRTLITLMQIDPARPPATEIVENGGAGAGQAGESTVEGILYERTIPN